MRTFILVPPILSTCLKLIKVPLTCMQDCQNTCTLTFVMFHTSTCNANIWRKGSTNGKTKVRIFQNCGLLYTKTHDMNTKAKMSQIFLWCTIYHSSILNNGSGCKIINDKLGSTKLNINHCLLDKENGNMKFFAFAKWTNAYH
jgi:hypothetical protein